MNWEEYVGKSKTALKNKTSFLDIRNEKNCLQFYGNALERFSEFFIIYLKICIANVFVLNSLLGVWYQIRQVDFKSSTRLILAPCLLQKQSVQWQIT